MRTIVDIPEEQVKILDRISKRKKVSRATIVRQALIDYITVQNQTEESYEIAFGIWKGNKFDSLLHQQKLREEWDR